MLKRLYANNFRCMVNSEITFDKLTLLLGPNGGGKSTIFELLFKIRHLLIDNARIGDVFQEDDLTIWLNSNEQTIELDVQGNGGCYNYKLVVSHNKSIGKQRIETESLYFDSNPLFIFQSGDAQLYHDDHKPGPKYTFDWTLSPLATIAPRLDNQKLTWFKKWVDLLFIISLEPKAMTSVAENESAWLNRNGTNFASWYRYISQEYQDKAFNLTDRLREIVPGFHAFKLETAGKQKILKVGFINGNKKVEPVYFDFEQISDGQRAMIVLYSLMLSLEDLGHTLFLDEPENYVSLPEIQPWLVALNDVCGEDFPQAVLISHHPELIDYFGPESGKWIERDPLGPIRVKPLPQKIDGTLKLSQLIARGWTE